MDNVISFTPSELAAFIGTIAGICAGIATIVGIIVKLVMKLKQPEIEQNKKIADLETRVAELEKQRSEDAVFHKEQEQTNKIILRTLQALLNLSLGVENAEALKGVADDLNTFLINK